MAKSNYQQQWRSTTPKKKIEAYLHVDVIAILDQRTKAKGFRGRGETIADLIMQSVQTEPKPLPVEHPSKESVKAQRRQKRKVSNPEQATQKKAKAQERQKVLASQYEQATDFVTVFDPFKEGEYEAAIIDHKIETYRTEEKGKDGRSRRITKERDNYELIVKEGNTLVRFVAKGELKTDQWTYKPIRFELQKLPTDIKGLKSFIQKVHPDTRQQLTKEESKWYRSRFPRGLDHVFQQVKELLAEKKLGMRHCEAQTAKGGRCKCEGTVYHRHTDGREYLSCKRHATFEFQPAPDCKGVKAAVSC